MQESREVRVKNKSKPSQDAHFDTSFWKYHCIYRKMINAYQLFIVKASVPINFVCLQIKMSLEMCQKMATLELRTALSTNDSA